MGYPSAVAAVYDRRIFQEERPTVINRRYSGASLYSVILDSIVPAKHLLYNNLFLCYVLNWGRAICRQAS